LKIAVVAPEFPPEIGGTQRYAEGLVKALISADVEVTVVLRKDSEYKESPEYFNVIKVLSIDYKKDRTALNSYWGKFDVWHVCNASYSWIGLFAPTVITIFGNDIIAPYLFTQKVDLRNNSILKRGDRFSFWASKIRTGRLQRKGLKHVEKVIAISHATKSIAQDKYPFLKGDIDVIPVGIPPFDKEKILSDNSWKTNLLTVCRLDEPRKNIEAIIHAIAKLKKDNVIYFIVGEGKQLAALESLTRTLGMEEQIIFEGRVSDKRLNELYANANLFILTPTIEENSIEGFGIVYLEANCHGVPVLATKAAGCLDAVSENISGYFVKAPTAENISYEINRFLEKEIQFDRDKVMAHADSFTWDKVVLKILEQYKRIMD